MTHHNYALLTSDNRLWLVRTLDKEYSYLGRLQKGTDLCQYLSENPDTVQGNLPDGYIEV